MEDPVEKKEEGELPQMICRSSHPVREFCMAPVCKETPLLCGRKDCQPCDSTHKRCTFVRSDPLLKKLGKKLKKVPIEVQEGFEKLFAMFDDSIEYLSQEKEKLEQHLEMYGLNQSEQALYKAVQSDQHDKINSVLVEKVVKSLRLDKMKQDRQESEGNMPDTKALLSAFEKMVNDTKEKLDKVGQAIQEFYISERWRCWIPGFQSAITQEVSLLANWLPKPARNCRKIFTASEHGFRSEAFHEHCDGIPHTLVLIQTEFGRIIGGYTPLKWDEPNDGNYSTDPSGTTFIFSITLREKYSLVKPDSRAILCRTNAGPRFGGSGGVDIEIHDQCNQADNTTSFPSSFNLNGKYSNNQTAHTALSGATKNWNFKVKEYEVFALEFEEQIEV